MACSRPASVSLHGLRILSLAQQADIPEAGCGFLQLGENGWTGPGNPGRWTSDGIQLVRNKVIKILLNMTFKFKYHIGIVNSESIICYLRDAVIGND